MSDCRTHKLVRSGIAPHIQAQLNAPTLLTQTSLTNKLNESSLVGIVNSDTLTQDEMDELAQNALLANSDETSPTGVAPAISRLSPLTRVEDSIAATSLQASNDISNFAKKAVNGGNALSLHTAGQAYTGAKSQSRHLINDFNFLRPANIRVVAGIEPAIHSYNTIYFTNSRSITTHNTDKAKEVQINLVPNDTFALSRGGTELKQSSTDKTNPLLNASCALEAEVAKSTQPVGTPAHTEMPTIADFDSDIISQDSSDCQAQGNLDSADSSNESTQTTYKRRK